MKDWEKYEKINKDILNEIDFIPYLKKHDCDTIQNLMSEISNDYDHTELTNNDVLKGFIFNWLGTDEFLDYLIDRYRNQIYYYEPADPIYYIEYVEKK